MSLSVAPAVPAETQQRSDDKKEHTVDCGGGGVRVATNITPICDVSDSTTVHLFPVFFLFVDTVKSKLTQKHG
jgi:hypothetical protein